MAEEYIPRGRGALLEMLRKHKEKKTSAGGEPPLEKLPPTCRGRAQILQKIQKMKEEMMGASAVVSPASSKVYETRRSQEVDKLSKTVESVTIEPPSEPRTCRGQAGTPISSTTNYVQLEVDQDQGIFEYEVRFQPDVDAKSNRIKLVNEALGEMKTTKVYDGDTCLYLPVQAFSDRRDFETLLPNSDSRVKVLMIYKRKRKMHECTHLYNVLFMRIMHVLLYKKMGRNYFSPEHKQLVPQHKLEVLPGFAVHVDETEGGLMICLDTQHRVIRSQTAYELFHEIMASNPGNFKQEVYKCLIGACVLTKYNNETYIVDDINWETNPRKTFKTRAGGECTFIDYYKVQYNITIQDVDQPLLVVLQKRKVSGSDVTIQHEICLIPELCYLTGLTDAMRNDFKVMKDVAVFTRITPNQRALALRTWLRRVKECEMAQKVLAGWGLKLADVTLDVPARVLPNEAIFFGGGEHGKFAGGSDWDRAVSSNTLTGPKDFNSWQLYYTRRDQRYAVHFAETLVRLSKGMGCVIRTPQHIVLDNDRTDTYMTAIRDHVTDTTQVAVFICPTIRADRYAVIKKMCCINTPVASQVILSKTLSNQQKVRTIIHRIGMQITCKLGGTLWCVKIPVTNWMVCGIDVYHSATKKESVCGFVASLDDALTRYYCEAVFQRGEIGDFFKVSFRRALQTTYEKRGAFPGKVVVFRDGIGDGQFEHCRRYEVPQFEEVLRELNSQTTLTYVVVQKRINTKIFRRTNEGGLENPLSGTVVDSVITRVNLADFFLVPQKVHQGTVNPTHYVVLHDNGKIKPDHIQRLAYKLCHLYYNKSGTIRVPAPCMYAHKLANMVGQHLKKTPSTKLNDKLWYL